MTVDMKQAIKGATVHFRCGGSAVVHSNNGRVSDNKTLHRVTFHAMDGTASAEYRDDGTAYGHLVLCLLDIIRIDPPAFDWATVKAGMAFIWDSPRADIVYHFLSHDLHESECGVFQRKHDKAFWQIKKDERWKRAPEHDIEVVQ